MLLVTCIYTEFDTQIWVSGEYYVHEIYKTQWPYKLLMPLFNFFVIITL